MSSIAPAVAVRNPATAITAAPKPVNLDAEKAKCESQLSDWVHCASAATPQGKAKIEELSSRLSAINSQLKEEATRKPAPDTRDQARPPRSALTTLGSVVDVFA